MIYDYICSLTKSLWIKQSSAISTEAMIFSAQFSGPLDARALFSASARWQLLIDSGPLSGRTIALSFRPDLSGPSMAFIEDKSGYSENPYITMTSSEKELLKFKHAAIAAKEGTLLRVEFDLKRPDSEADLLPYEVRAFCYSVHSSEASPVDETLH